ncbi:MAG: hypothetical protein ACHP7N_01485 [Caulobacterales bacterium]
MSLSDFASIGSFVSGLAVVITLAFLLAQLRQNSRNQRSLIQQARADRYAALLLKPSEPFLAEATARAFQSDLALTAPQILAFVRMAGATFWHYEDSFLQHRARTIDPASAEADVASLRMFLTVPANRVAWTINRDYFAGAYRDHVDRLLLEVKAAAFPDIVTLWRSSLAAEVPTL